MYCPNCAASIDGVKFCRSCGANVSLVPQALTGQLAAAPEPEGRRGRRRRNQEPKPPGVDTATTNIFAGIGLIIASFVVMRLLPGGMFWGWVFLIPGFSHIGKGVGEYLRWKGQQDQLSPPPPSNLAGLPGLHSLPSLDAPDTAELADPPSATPPSVTEDTTRRFDPK
ncbi:MAG TPA: zinc ribbon domain-containing protein [Blastocatellia bacterium]|nr:zinc ribbon domain-containing protein [Blastocatellia bacterium]